MTKEEVLDWMIDNIPEFPTSVFNCMNIPAGNWHWWHIGMGIVALNDDTGEFVNSDEFYQARYEARLRPCGMSFKMVMEDLKL